MGIDNKDNSVIDKIESGILWVTGTIITTASGIAIWFFKNFLTRLTKAETQIATLETKVVSIKEVMTAQTEQNTKQHSDIGIVLKESVALIRKDQEKMDAKLDKVMDKLISDK